MYLVPFNTLDTLWFEVKSHIDTLPAFLEESVNFNHPVAQSGHFNIETLGPFPRCSPLSGPMADWFMDECIMFSDWTLGGRGGI